MSCGIYLCVWFFILFFFRCSALLLGSFAFTGGVRPRGRGSLYRAQRYWLPGHEWVVGQNKPFPRVVARQRFRVCVTASVWRPCKSVPASATCVGRYSLLSERWSFFIDFRAIYLPFVMPFSERGLYLLTSLLLSDEKGCREAGAAKATEPC